jgi:uncharacterized Zn finger protein
MQMSSKNKIPKLRPKSNSNLVRCPCCGEVLNVSITPNDTGFLINEQYDEDKIKNALKKNGIELASRNGGE